MLAEETAGNQIGKVRSKTPTPIIFQGRVCQEGQDTVGHFGKSF